MSALEFAIWTACINACSLWLWLIKAVTTPILARPSHVATYSGRFSISRAIVSPFLNPTDEK